MRRVVGEIVSSIHRRNIHFGGDGPAHIVWIVHARGKYDRFMVHFLIQNLAQQMVDAI
jgi:hypothetical protein